MSKRVLFYARYSTDRQNEVSIETQVELGKGFVEQMGWTLVEVYSDSAVSGSDFHVRPGIQQLLAHVRREKINVVLCITVDRLSRDVQHSDYIRKVLDKSDAKIWTVHSGQPVTNMELGLRAVLSQELVEQIRYRTREGMKTAVRKGKATTCLAYGYKLSHVLDESGDRIKGLRDLDPEKAEIVLRIFQMYADGVSPRDIAAILNKEGIEGPRGRRWRDTAIRGHVSRGSGILNNETYIGRMIWNKRNFSKDPDTERRTARANAASDWVISEVPHLRIISDELWARVKQRQMTVAEHFSHTTSNRLNASHRPTYLLSGLLECAECGGPYAISGKERYGCTNHRKRLPIDELDGACCSNAKTIKRKDVEDRVLTCLPPAFLGLGLFERISDEVKAKLRADVLSTPDLREKLSKTLRGLEDQQKQIIRQISERAAEGRPRLGALDDMLDELEARRSEMEQQLAAIEVPTDMEDFAGRINKLQSEVSPEVIEFVTNSIFYFMREHADTETKQPYVSMVRDLIQKVVIGAAPGHQPATIEVHGRIASILAAMEATTIMEKQFIAQKHYDFMARQHDGRRLSNPEKQKLLDAYAEELSQKRLAWKNLQVSVVAGAGFEPAAFRL